MKSYTDIEQSKRLAEILPLESADTIWDLTNPDLPTIRAIPYEDSDYNNKYLNIIPAWSLATLYSVLPTFTLDSSDDKYFRIHCCNKFSEWYNNPVDACVAMIEKLHKQNLI